MALAPAPPRAHAQVEEAATGAGDRRPRTRRSSRPRPGPAWLWPVGVATTLLAAFGVALVLQVSVLSHLEQARSQRLAYAQLRSALATVTAPTGQTRQVGADQVVLPLGTPVGYIDADWLGLEREVLLEGSTGAVLAQGPGHVRSTVLPGQAGTSVLYGRAWSFGAPFGDIDQAVPGAEITVTTGQGEHTYLVTGVRRAGDPVPPPPVTADGEGRLTLVTASGRPFTPDGVRYVDADLASTAVPAPARAFTFTSLLPSEQALASDPGAWVPVLLLLQGLAGSALAAVWSAQRWGRRQTWLVAFPVIGVLLLVATREVARLLPNLL